MDLQWINEVDVSEDRTRTLYFLNNMKIPNNIKNAFHKRRDLFKQYIVETEELRNSLDVTDGIEAMRLYDVKCYLEWLVDIMDEGYTYCNHWYIQQKVNSSLKNFKKITKAKFIGEIMDDEGSRFWWTGE